MEARSSGKIERRGAAIDERCGATIDDRRGLIIGLELSLWSSDWSSGFAGKVSSSSLFAIWALSSLSLSLSLSLRKCFEVKLGTENNFRGQSLIFTVDRRSARFDHRTGARSVVVGLELRVRRQSLFFLSLCDLGSLFSLSLSSEML